MANIRPIISDPEVIRASIQSKILEAVRNKFPIKSNNYTAELKNLTVKQIEVGSADEADALMARTNLHDGVYADIDIISREGKKVGELKNHRIMNIPYYTSRYTIMLDGHEYSIVSQMRTKSGIYTRKRGNDELESAFNLAKGANFKLIMDPDTGLFKVDMLGSTMPALAVLKILGATPADISQAIGQELYTKNADISPAQIERTRTTLFTKLVRYKADGSDDLLTTEEKDAAIRKYFSETSIDEETTKITLGKSYSSVSPLSIIAAMAKLIEVYKGEGDVDERDHLEFQKIYSVEDLLKEVLDKAPDIVLKVKTKLDSFKPTMDKETGVKALKNAFSPIYFNKPIGNFITGSSLSRMPAQINPVEFLDSASIITRLGEGGISSERAVPFETRDVNNSYIGVIDPIAAPESSKVGIDVHCTMGALKGDDNEFYKEVINCKTGKHETLKVIQLHEKRVGFPDPGYKTSKSSNDIIACVYKGKIEKVKRSELDYQIISPHEMTTYTSNTIPFINANQGNRLLMGDKHIQQSLPLLEPEKRLVSTAIGNSSVEKVIGSWTLPKSPVNGTVVTVDRNNIVIKGEDGKKYFAPYSKNFALATKTFIDDKIRVKAGDKVKKGQVLADNNFTKDGELAMGRNLTVAYMPYMGLNHEDGVVLSESASKKFTSVHADKVTLNLDDTITLGKKKYSAVYPTNFTTEQLDKLDDDGVVMEGMKLIAGDPVILAMGKAEASRQNQVLGLLHKSLINPYSDMAEIYEEKFEGEVTGVQKTKSLITVIIKVPKVLQVGDKVAGSYGNKGVCSKIMPDDQMPRTADGNPVDCVLTSTSVISRVNPSQILETTLGKIAKKKGITYHVENFSQPDYVKFVRDEMEKHNISDKEDLLDPVTGKTINNVFVGVQHMHKLFKTSDTNFAGRGVEGPHDMDESPTGSGFIGPKAIGGMEVNALIAHNARSILKESTVLRSSKNMDFWKAFQKGMNPNYPNEKKTFTRFIDILKQAGINVTKQGDYLCAAPLTDKDILGMSSGEVKEAKILFKDLTPESGGLFDTKITGGLQGTKWSHIKLIEPVINPVFEDAAKSILKLSTKELNELYMSKGGKEIRKQLNAVNVADELKKETEALNSGTLTKGALNDSVKRVGFLRALKENGMTPGEAYTLSVVPVTPPTVRPIVVGKTGDHMDNDANTLYKNIVLLNNQFKKSIEAGFDTDEDMAENRKALVDSVKELTGVIDPSSQKLKNRGVKGALSFIAGDVPKEGYFQRKVIYGKMNLTGRSTITPDITVGMDEVGLPENIAWSMYKPFVMRGMAQLGYNPLVAKENIEKRSDVAKKVLEEEMSRRPVIINRAPTLWRHGIVAATPHMVSDTNLHINSLWESGMNADYDGDAVQIHLPVSEEAIKDAQNMFPSKQLFSDKKKNDLIQSPTKEPIIGLYKVTENVGKPRTGGTIHTYNNVQEAWKDYYAGKLKMTDYVKIG